MNEIFKMGLILCAITLLAGFSLGSVYEITKEPIAEQKQKAQQVAMQAVLKKAERFEMTDQAMDETQEVKEIQIGYQGDQIVGYVMKVVTKGYGGEIEMMVGMDQDGVIEGIKILRHAETPGLGAKAQEQTFCDQYANKSAEQELWVTKSTPTTEQEIEALTGATITTNAVTEGVNTALKMFEEKIK
ncbi:MAG: RnfABCDGE type electron transport complex subunit G [Epulopiscium sp.]|nr:RnfABCDGE type electron transport complex subunit G [Candidatus Epulonipiscium sp.]